jgi:hypothetical protein
VASHQRYVVLTPPAVIKIHRLRPASLIDEINVVTLTTRPRIAK